MTLKVQAIVPAAGAGLRMGADIRKQYIQLQGKPILVHTLQNLCKCELITDISLVVPEDDKKYCAENIVKHHNLHKVGTLISGGKERQDSVHNAIKQLPNDTDIVLVHDAVRPFITNQIIEKSINTANEFGTSVIAVPEKDTVKEVTKEGIVTKTLERDKLWRIQTPQTFRREIIVDAFKKAYDEGFLGTDEASLVEFSGKPVRVVIGSYFNIKITTPEDMLFGEAILNTEIT